MESSLRTENEAGLTGVRVIMYLLPVYVVVYSSCFRLFCSLALCTVASVVVDGQDTLFRGLDGFHALYAGNGSHPCHQKATLPFSFRRFTDSS